MRGGNSKGLLNICRLKYHYVYQTKNLINGKTYIGRHSTNNLKDGYLGSGKMLKRAIQKYGKENFKCIPMCYFDTYEESVEEEKFIVTKEYCERTDNYNIVEGGSNPIMYGELNPSTGRKLNEEEILKNRVANSHNFTPVIVDDVFYDSLATCMRDTGIKDGLYIIRRCLCDNFHNFKFHNESDFIKYNIKYGHKFKCNHTPKGEKNEKAPRIRKPKIIKSSILKTNTSIKVAENIFNTLADCAKFYNINGSTVDSRCVSPHFKDWEYIDKAHQKKREEIYYTKVDKRYARKRAKTAENRKPVMIIEGKFYYSFKEAGRDYGMWYETIQRRGILDEFPDWIFPTQEDIDKYKAKFERERNRVRVYKKKK